MNYVVSETITAGNDSYELQHPFNDYDCAAKMCAKCINESTDDDYISFLVIDDEGSTYELPII